MPDVAGDSLADYYAARVRKGMVDKLTNELLDAAR